MEYEGLDPTVDEGVQLHGSMVTWWILDLLISAEQPKTSMSNILLEKQYIVQQLGLSGDLPMTLLQ